MSPQPDGSTTLWATLSGLDAETVATGIDAFRTFDAPGTPPRSPAQRTADALVAMARAALDHGLTTTDHGSRPHVTVTIGWSELCAAAGLGETTWTGPITAADVRRMLPGFHHHPGGHRTRQPAAGYRPAVPVDLGGGVEGHRGPRPALHLPGL